MNSDPKEWLRTGIWGPTFEGYPGYAWVLARLATVEDPKVPVMAVSLHGGRFRLHVNRAYFEEYPEFLPGVLLHEIHHVVLGHLTNPRFRGVVYPDLMTLAMEVSANEYIREPLPGHPCCWEDYQALGLAPHQSTRERYELLATARRAGRLRRVVVRLVDTHDFAANEAAGPAAEPPLLKELRAKLAESGLPDGTPWTAGRTPGSLLASLGQAAPSTPTPIDWRSALAAFAGQLRQPDWSYTRPNRRFPERIGVVPGRLRRQGSGGPLALLVVIDTSGSMEDAVLADVSQQVDRLVAQTGARVTVVECDAAIQRVYPLRRGVMDVQGRGGTDLRPVFEPEFLARHRPDGVIYFTDGEGPYPERDPGVPTLWILFGPGPFQCPWGRQVRFDG